METKKLKVVRGSEEHPEIVKKWLKEQGATNVENYDCDSKLYYYCVVDGKIYTEYTEEWIWKCIDHEVVELEEPKPKHVFHPFEKVLVRNYDCETWRINHFGQEVLDAYVCENGSWYQCIPYEGNEHLLGTTDSPKKGGEQ